MLFMGHTCFKNQTRRRAITPSILPTCSLSPRPTFARFRSFFSTSFPSTASLFLFRSSLRNGVFRRYSLSQLLHPLPRRNSPGPAGNVSRILQNVSRLSYYTSASYPPTKQRILVWIEFLMEPTPPGPRSHPLQPSRFPSPLYLVRECSARSRALSANRSERHRRRLLPDIDFFGHAVSSPTKSTRGRVREK